MRIAKPGTCGMLFTAGDRSLSSRIVRAEATLGQVKNSKHHAFDRVKNSFS
jgi:hypothetical protein